MTSLQTKLGMFDCTTDHAKNDYCTMKTLGKKDEGRCQTALSHLCPDTSNKFRFAPHVVY
jgi:hypothetical protein